MASPMLALARVAAAPALMLAAMLPGPVLAEAAAAETATLGTAVVTIHPQTFLDEVELGTLRAVMTNEQALAIFVGEKGGHAAMAVSPEDGFIRDGKPTASAMAIGGMADIEAAKAEALKGCNGKKAGASECVIVLTVSPAA